MAHLSSGSPTPPYHSSQSYSIFPLLLYQATSPRSPSFPPSSGPQLLLLLGAGPTNKSRFSRNGEASSGSWLTDLKSPGACVITMGCPRDAPWAACSARRERRATAGRTGIFMVSSLGCSEAEPPWWPFILARGGYEREPGSHPSDSSPDHVAHP